MDPGNSFAFGMSPQTRFQPSALLKKRKQEPAKRAAKKPVQKKGKKHVEQNVATDVEDDVEKDAGSNVSHEQQSSTTNPTESPSKTTTTKKAVNLFQSGDTIIKPNPVSEKVTRILYLVATQTPTDRKNAYLLKLDSCWQSLEQAKQRIAEIAREKQARRARGEITEVRTEFHDRTWVSDLSATNPPSLQLKPHVTAHELDSTPARGAGDSMEIQSIPNNNPAPSDNHPTLDLSTLDAAVSFATKASGAKVASYSADITSLKLTSTIKTKGKHGGLFSNSNDRRDEVWVVSKYNIDEQNTDEAIGIWKLDAVFATAKAAMDYAVAQWKAHMGKDLRTDKHKNNAGGTLRPAQTTPLDSTWLTCPQIKVESARVKELPHNSILVTSETSVTYEDYPASANTAAKNKRGSAVPSISAAAPFAAMPGPASEAGEPQSASNNLLNSAPANRRSVSMKHRPLSSVSGALSAAEARRSVTESVALTNTMQAAPSPSQEELQIRSEMSRLEQRLRQLQLRASQPPVPPAELEAGPIKAPISAEARASEHGSEVRGDSLDEIYETAAEEEEGGERGVAVPRTRPATPLSLDRMLALFPGVPASDPTNMVEEEVASPAPAPAE